MRSGEYPHPPDEFDAAARAGGPRGVHRTPRSWWSRWWPFVVVLVVFPALAYGGITFLSEWEGLPGGNDAAQTPAPDETDDGTAEEPEDEVAEPTEPEVTPEPTPEPPPADLARTVEVLNATTTSGLAGGARDRLEDAGFTAVTTANWSGTDPPTSVVYYTTAADLGTAELIASTLGIGTVQESAEIAAEAVTVVLVGDYVA